MFLNFVGRDLELRDLEQRRNSNRFEFVVIYGRRRIGKTTLIKKFLDDKDGLYFLCDKGGTERNAKRLKRKIAQYLNEPVMESNDLYDIFEHLALKMKKNDVIVLDEFSYLVEKDDSIPSVFQNLIDETLSKTSLNLIVCGSSMSMMERGVLSSKSPLYGRKTGHMKIEELSFNEICKMFPKNNIEENIKFASVLGGVPYYLEKFTDKRGVNEQIIDEIFARTGGLYEEVEFLLKEEFREPDVYKAILSVISSGGTRLVDIANKSGIRATDLPKYLNSLIALNMVHKEYSILDKRKKKPQYVIKDNFINFWFRFCEPYKSDLEFSDLKTPLCNLDQNFNSYVGERFESLIREQYARKLIPFSPQEIGRLWYGEIEIDIVSVDKKNAVFIEVKYKKNVSTKKIMTQLDEKIDQIPLKQKNISKKIVALSFSSKLPESILFKDLLKM